MSRKRMVLLPVLVCLLVAVPMGTVARGQESQKDEGMRLSLADALRAALEKNLDLVIARKSPKIAEIQIEIPKAAFDPALQATGTYTNTRQDQTQGVIDTLIDPPNTATIGSSSVTSRDKPLSGQFSWSQLLKFGGTYGVSWDYRQSHPSDSLVAFGPITFQTQSKSRSFVPTISFVQPLMKGFGTEVNTADVVLAKSNLAISQETLKLNAENTMQQVENAYWDLVAAREAQRVARESLKLAQDLYDLNKKKVEVGTLAPIEITQAEAGVASREEGVIVAATLVQNAEDNLRMLMAVPKDDPAWSRSILPVDEPQYEARTVDVDSTLAKALDLRPEIVTARRNLHDQELSERVARNGIRQDLRLNAELTPLGKSESYYTFPTLNEANQPISRQRDDYNESFDWSVALTYTFPIGNRANKANYAIKSLNREQAELTLKNWEQSIRVDVRRAARSVESGAKRVQAARANTVLQRKTLDAEQKKFENGMSTSFEVLRIQNDLFTAQLADIQAITSYTKALADLELAQGTLLEARGLRLESGKGK